MAYKTKFLNYATQARFDTDLANGLIDSKSIVFIQDTKRIWTHGNFFDTLWNYIGGKPATFAPSAHTLDSHSNVTITSNTAGEILKWNGSNWVNNTLAEAGIAAASHTHSYLPLSGGTLTGNVSAPNIIGVLNASSGNYSTGSIETCRIFIDTSSSISGFGNDAFIFEKSDANSVYPDSPIAFVTVGNDGVVRPRLVILGNGNIGIGTTSPAYKLDVSGTGRFTGNLTAPTFIGNLSGKAATATKVSTIVTGTNTAELVSGIMADNDYFRILIGGTASNAGYVEIATADDGTEPIYVRQYRGVFANLVRTATLLDSSGNTTFPGSVTATSFLGNASTATALTTNAGSNTNPIYFSGGKPTASSYSFGNANGNIPISNGTLNSNLNADLLDGNHSSFFRQTYNATIKKGVWSRILYATPINLFGSFMLTVQYTRNSVVVGNTFLITFGHSYHGQITVLGTHGYTQIGIRLTGDSNNIYVELFDIGVGTVGDIQIAKISLDNINANITTYSDFIDGSTVFGSIKSQLTTENNRINVDGNTVAFLTDNAATATKLQTARTISLTGDVTGSTSFNGSTDVSITATIADDSHNHIISNIDNLQTTLDSKIDIFPERTLSITANNWVTIATCATGRAYGEFYVYDATSGRHNAVKIIASASYGQNAVVALAGNRYNIRTIAHVRILYNTANRTYGGAKLQVYCENPTFTLYVRRILTNKLSGWTGWNDITPVAEGTPSGWAEDTTTRFDDITNTAYSLNGNLSGNASTATKLQTARTIAGVSFDGTANIAIPFANLSSKPTTLSGYGITDAPTKTGGGASGTWGINITGSAANATSSQYLISSGSSIVSSPGTGRVKYDYGIQSGTAGLFPISDNSNAVLSLNRHSGNYDSQLGFSSNGNIYYRKFSNVALDTTTPWRLIWDSGNFNPSNKVDVSTYNLDMGNIAALLDDINGTII